MVRLLKESEIELRVQSVRENGFILLLYKDARVDMQLLDETFGPTGWKRKHELIGERLYCTISVWDEDKKQWIDKQDVGTESYTEKEKGQASDSFKRAAVNVGIGRELYTAPFIWVEPSQGEIQKNQKGSLYIKTTFSVSEIEYNDSREICLLAIVDNKGNERYRYGGKNASTGKISNYNTKRGAKDNTKTQNNAKSTGKELTIGKVQQKALFDAAQADSNLVKFVISNRGYESTKAILVKDYGAIVKEIEDLVKENRG